MFIEALSHCGNSIIYSIKTHERSLHIIFVMNGPRTLRRESWTATATKMMMMDLPKINSVIQVHRRSVTFFFFYKLSNRTKGPNIINVAVSEACHEK